MFNSYVENTLLFRQEKTIFTFLKRWKNNEKNTTSTVQMTTVREHIKTTVAYRRNSTHFLRNQPIQPTTRDHHNTISWTARSDRLRKNGMSVYFLLLLFSFLSLLFFFLSLLLVGRDRRRSRCGRGCAVIAAVLFGRDHGRRGCGRVRGRGHGGLAW